MKLTYLLFRTSNYPIQRTNYSLLNHTDVFDEIKLLTENDLDNNIRSIINNIFEKYGDRGYGYWIWKPYLILQELNKMEENDILFHSNIHADFLKMSNLKGVVRHICYDLRITEKPIFLGTHGEIEKQWSTTKLIKYLENKLNYKYTEDDLNGGQFGGGTIWLRKNNFTVNFIKTWFNLMSNGIEYISDAHNHDNDNDEIFCENRHDQSCLSLLYKYYKLPQNKFVNYMNGCQFNI